MRSGERVLPTPVTIRIKSSPPRSAFPFLSPVLSPSGTTPFLLGEPRSLWDLVLAALWLGWGVPLTQACGTERRCWIWEERWFSVQVRDLSEGTVSFYFSQKNVKFKVQKPTVGSSHQALEELLCVTKKGPLPVGVASHRGSALLECVL